MGMLHCMDYLTIASLQKIQNSAAQVILGLNKFDHVTPALKSLHWLPIRYKIQYKILIHTYKAFKGDVPGYIREMLQVNNSSYNLSSTIGTNFIVPKCNFKTFGDRAFSSSAPNLSNKLPDTLKVLDNLNYFKSQLKTHLFSLAFNC